MIHGISEIVDFLLAQVHLAGGAEKAATGQHYDGRERMNWQLPQAADFGGLAASEHGLCPATVVNLISEDMLSEEDRSLYFPAPAVERPDILCHRLVVMTETGISPLVLTVYYNPGGLNMAQPRYVVDNDIWVRESGRFWSFISVVTGGGDEARRFIETFIGRLGFSSSFEVTEEGDRLLVTRLRPH